jgi:hypothetical protein
MTIAVHPAPLRVIVRVMLRVVVEFKPLVPTEHDNDGGFVAAQAPDEFKGRVYMISSRTEPEVASSIQKRQWNDGESG